MGDSEFLFLQEICLYETALNKLLKLGHNSDIIATSAMNLYRESADHLGVLLLFGIHPSNINLLKLIVLVIGCVGYYMVITTHSQCY